MTIDLSADVGEGADDLPLFPLVTSISVACGAHAGDLATMERCVAEAARLGVVVGAHPGYPDAAGAGRRAVTISDAELTTTLVEQIEALREICGRHGVPLVHVKPHGALYNQAAVDASLAATIARAVRAVDPALRLVGLAGSALVSAASDAGLRVIAEAFADRRYLADGTLVPRGSTGALITDPIEAAAQALALIPGFSRSGATMGGGLLVGLSNKDAARFAFLLATPIIGAAALLKIPDLLGPHGDGVRGQALVASLCSAVTAYLAVRFLMRFFETNTLTPFAAYCAAAGTACFLYFVL